MDVTIKNIEENLKQIEEDLIKAKNQIETLKKKNYHSSEPSDQFIISYFSYTVKCPTDPDNQIVQIFGSFIIKNVGNVPLKSPYICIKFNDYSPISLAARISSKDRIDQEYSPVPTQTWNFINQELEKRVESDGEYWLSPLNVYEIPPQKNLSFANFHARLDCSQYDGTLKMEGYVYGEGIESGVPSLNKINVSI